MRTDNIEMRMTDSDIIRERAIVRSVLIYTVSISIYNP